MNFLEFLPLLLLPFLRLATSSSIPLQVPTVPNHVSPGLNISVGPGPVCSELSTGFSTACFLSQNVSGYLSNFNISIAPETCAPNETWSVCFQNYAYAAPSSKIPIRTLVAANHSCTTLTTSANNSYLCSRPDIHAKQWTQGDWYGAWAIYLLQSHISVWAQAITASSSADAITNITTAHPTSNASAILTTLISKYGLDLAADKALRGLINAPVPVSLIPHPVPLTASTTGSTTGSTSGTPQRVPLPTHGDDTTTSTSGSGSTSTGGSGTASASEWQSLLQSRLAEVLVFAMKDFDVWFAAIKGGAYSVPTLAVAGQLENQMKKP